MSANVSELKPGDKCKIEVEWIPRSILNSKRVQIIRFQQHGREMFAKVLWLGRQSKELEEQYGNLFHIKELRAL